VGHFSVQTRPGEELLIVAVSGECDLACRQELATALQAAVSKAPVVAVDLAGVRFLDSSGLHCLVVAYQEAVAQGKVLYATGATGAVAQVLDLTGVAVLLAPPADGSR
jgi:anti-anti-sigma factor